MSLHRKYYFMTYMECRVLVHPRAIILPIEIRSLNLSLKAGIYRSPLTQVSGGFKKVQGTIMMHISVCYIHFSSMFLWCTPNYNINTLMNAYSSFTTSIFAERFLANTFTTRWQILTGVSSLDIGSKLWFWSKPKAINPMLVWLMVAKLFKDKWWRSAVRLTRVYMVGNCQSTSL